MARCASPDASHAPSFPRTVQRQLCARSSRFRLGQVQTRRVVVLLGPPASAHSAAPIGLSAGQAADDAETYFLDETPMHPTYRAGRVARDGGAPPAATLWALLGGVTKFWRDGCHVEIMTLVAVAELMCGHEDELGVQTDAAGLDGSCAGCASRLVA